MTRCQRKNPGNDDRKSAQRFFILLSDVAGLALQRLLGDIEQASAVANNQEHWSQTGPAFCNVESSTAMVCGRASPAVNVIAKTAEPLSRVSVISLAKQQKLAKLLSGGYSRALALSVAARVSSRTSSTISFAPLTSFTSPIPVPAQTVVLIFWGPKPASSVFAASACSLLIS